jgi:D-amino-acid oxidase
MRERRVAIIGAGVSGLTCGVFFAEQGWRAQILAEAIGQKTTSGAAAAIWFPYDAEPLPEVIQWSLTSLRKLRALACERGSGVSLIELRQCARATRIEIPSWAPALGAQELGSIIHGFGSGFALSVPLTDTSRYLDYLRERFEAGGGRIEETRIKNFADIPAEFELIVNCAGLGARELTGDLDLESHRGQVLIVPKLDLAHAIVCDEAPLMYAIPRTHDCVFGGTNQLSEDMRPSATDTALILAECSRVLSIKAPRVLAERVGLRPYRKSGVRLEAEKLPDARTVIHNYGHGGAGFTVSWGCAEQVFALANQL